MTAWYAVRTRSNFEARVADGLTARDCENFLPTYRTRRRWSDRVRESDTPLSNGYVFCRFEPSQRLPIVTTPGVVHIVSAGSEPIVVDDSEIQRVRTFLQSNLPVGPWPFLKAGQPVRLTHGPLAGAEGIIQQVKDGYRLVTSITLLQRSVAVEIDRDWVQPA